MTKKNILMIMKTKNSIWMSICNANNSYFYFYLLSKWRSASSTSLRWLRTCSMLSACSVHSDQRIFVCQLGWRARLIMSHWRYYYPLSYASSQFSTEIYLNWLNHFAKRQTSVCTIAYGDFWTSNVQYSAYLDVPFFLSLHSFLMRKSKKP